MQEKIALPTVGRIVHAYFNNVGPFAATVTQAWPDELRCDLFIFPCRGKSDTKDGPVKPVPEGMDTIGYLVPHVSTGAHGMRWDWMPFQKGQAAKTEELQAELDKAAGKLSVRDQRTSDSIDDRELSKTQAGAPSPVDGKR